METEGSSQTLISALRDNTVHSPNCHRHANLTSHKTFSWDSSTTEGYSSVSGHMTSPLLNEWPIMINEGNASAQYSGLY